MQMERPPRMAFVCRVLQFNMMDFTCGSTKFKQHDKVGTVGDIFAVDAQDEHDFPSFVFRNTMCRKKAGVRSFVMGIGRRF